MPSEVPVSVVKAYISRYFKAFTSKLKSPFPFGERPGEGPSPER
jgi:hypothetical protein